MIKYIIVFSSSEGGIFTEFRRIIFKNDKYNIKILAVDSKKIENAKSFSAY